MPAVEPRGISPLVAAVVALVALAAGATGGALFERSRRPATKDAPAETPGATAARKSPATPSADNPSASDPSGPATGAPAASLAEAQKEVAQLKERVAELEKLVPHEKTKEDKLALAKEMMECLRKGKQDPAAFRRLLQLIAELDPAMGPYFIERLEDPNETADKKPLYDLILASGGPEVADWLLAKLNDTATDENMRHRLLRVLGGSSKEIFNMRNLPVNAALADLAYRYASATEGDERRAAAGLLGGVPSVESRTVLCRLASTDPDNDVKEAAVRSLALAGDKDTLAWLDTYQPTITGLNEWEQKRLQVAIDYTRAELKKRFP